MEQTETKKTKWFFSLFSGEIYEVPLEEARLLDAHQLALKEKPDTGYKCCKKCNGKLYVTYLTPSNVFELCRKCGRKYIDLAYMKIPMNKR